MSAPADVSTGVQAVELQYVLEIQYSAPWRRPSTTPCILPAEAQATTTSKSTLIDYMSPFHSSPQLPTSRLPRRFRRSATKGSSGSKSKTSRRGYPVFPSFRDLASSACIDARREYRPYRPYELPKMFGFRRKAPRRTPRGSKEETGAEGPTQKQPTNLAQNQSNNRTRLLKAQLEDTRGQLRAAQNNLAVETSLFLPKPPKPTSDAVSCNELRSCRPPLDRRRKNRFAVGSAARSDKDGAYGKHPTYKREESIEGTARSSRTGYGGV